VVARSMLELLRPGMLGHQVKTACGRNHDVGTGGRTQSLVRINLGHEPEVLRDVFRADTMHDNGSGTDVSMPAFELQNDSFNIHCDINWQKHY